MYYWPESDDDDDGDIVKEPQSVKCIICHEDYEARLMHGCKDDDDSSDMHCMCSDCFLGYSNAELSGGAFEGIRYFGGDSSSTLVSSPGNLPCPRFVTGECETASIPLTTLFSVFQTSHETAKLYYLASRRVMYQEVEQDRQLEAIEADSANPTGDSVDDETHQAAIEAIRLRVQAALDKGAVVKCPQCRQPGIKNSQCIHIRCHLCSTSWCYCCGRTRESSASNSIRCRGCDTFDSRLETQPPDWDTFGIGRESAAYGALHEFHRRRQAYFVRDVKMSIVPYQWQAFQATYPNILKDVPTPGRRIKWKELESPVVPPFFGDSRERDLLWAHRPRWANVTETERGEEVIAQDNEPVGVPPTVLIPWSQVFRSRGGIQWVLLVTAVVLMIAAGVMFDLFTEAFWYSAFLGMTTILFYHTTLFLLMRIADYFELHPASFAARCFPEIQFVGRRRNVDGDGEGPYFSASGRWRHRRRHRLAIPVLWLSLGGYLLSISIYFGSSTVGAIGFFFVVPILILAILQSLLLNYSPLPPLDAGNRPMPLTFSIMMGQLQIFHFLFIGIGGALLYSQTLIPAGVFLVILGGGLTLAELVPRFFSENFLAVQRPHRVHRSWTFWLGMVVLLYCLWYYFIYSDGQAIAAVIVGPILALVFWRAAATPERNANADDPVADPVADLEEGGDHAEAAVGQVETELVEVVVDDEPEIVVRADGPS